MFTVVRNAPTLHTKLRGLLLHNGSVAQYKGIQYATVAARFAPPVPVDSLADDVVDCTRHGPISPDLKIDFERPLYNIPDEQEIPSIDDATEDEFNCLNLVISAPTDGGLHPVFLFIHGGANIQDSTYRRVDDLASFVAASVNFGRPVVGVAINFRHRFFGFSTIEGKGNLGLYDQRCAMEWVQRHIVDFGGDHSRVVLAGDSAGATACDSHLHTDASKGLFHRAIMFSGALGTLPLRSVHEQQITMKRCCEALGVEWKDGWEKELAKVPMEDFAEVIWDIKHLAMHGTDDGYFHGRFEPEFMPDWCDAVMLGTNDFESTTWQPLITLFSQEEIINAVKGTLPAEYAEQLLKNYNLTTEIDRDEFNTNVFDFITDALYVHPVGTVARRWRRARKHVYEFIIDEPNPFRMDQRAMHGTNLIYAFGSYEFDTDRAKYIRDQMQKHLLAFVYNEAPWPKESVFGYGPDGTCGTLSPAEVEKRRRISKHEFLNQIDTTLVLKTVNAIIKGRAARRESKL